MALALTSRRRAIAAAASAAMAMALAVAVVGRGCAVGSPGPVTAVRAMIDAANAGDRQAVFELFSPETRARLEDQAQRATDFVGSSTRYQALGLVSLGAPEDNPAPTEINLIRQDGDRATVEVVGPAGRGEITVIRVDGRWLIDLPSYGTGL